MRSRLGVITSGCIIMSLAAPDARTPGQCRARIRSVEHYVDSSPYFGAVGGRYANRIAGARFSIDGREHRCRPTSRRIISMAGQGVRQALWQAEASGTEPPPSFAAQARLAKKGIQGPSTWRFPTPQRPRSAVRYQAAADAPTHVNLTQHSYFNLRGTGDVLSHCLSINASTYLPVDAS